MGNTWEPTHFQTVLSEGCIFSFYLFSSSSGHLSVNSAYILNYVIGDETIRLELEDTKGFDTTDRREPLSDEHGNSAELSMIAILPTFYLHFCILFPSFQLMLFVRLILSLLISAIVAHLWRFASKISIKSIIYIFTSNFCLSVMIFSNELNKIFENFTSLQLFILLQTRWVCSVILLRSSYLSMPWFPLY